MPGLSAVDNNISGESMASRDMSTLVMRSVS